MRMAKVPRKHGQGRALNVRLFFKRARRALLTKINALRAVICENHSEKREATGEAAMVSQQNYCGECGKKLISKTRFVQHAGRKYPHLMRRLCKRRMPLLRLSPSRTFPSPSHQELEYTHAVKYYFPKQSFRSCRGRNLLACQQRTARRCA